MLRPLNPPRNIPPSPVCLRLVGRADALHLRVINLTFDSVFVSHLTIKQFFFLLKEKVGSLVPKEMFFCEKIRVICLLMVVFVCKQTVT